MTRRALITGIGGQDGSLLAEQLVEDRYEVVGVCRRAPSEYPSLEQIAGRVELIEVDVTDRRAVEQVVRTVEPAEVYNLAAPSFVPGSWADPVACAHVIAVGATVLLEAVRQTDAAIRFCQASSSEVFGDPVEVPQTERTPLAAVTPYGIAKAYAHRLTGAYRARHGLHASSAILFNHESPRRPPEFLPRKVSLGVARIHAGLETELVLGDLDARRDWGFAGDYVRSLRAMTGAAEPDDYVIATGELHSVGELAAVAFRHLGLEPDRYIRVDPALMRPRRAAELVGDARKARDRLGWAPSMTFDELVRLMVDSDVDRLAAAARS